MEGGVTLGYKHVGWCKLKLCPPSPTLVALEFLRGMKIVANISDTYNRSQVYWDIKGQVKNAFSQTSMIPFNISSLPSAKLDSYACSTMSVSKPASQPTTQSKIANFVFKIIVFIHSIRIKIFRPCLVKPR